MRSNISDPTVAQPAVAAPEPHPCQGTWTAQVAKDRRARCRFEQIQVLARGSFRAGQCQAENVNPIPSGLQRLLLVDDSAAFVAVAAPGLMADGFEVVGVAADGREGVDLADRLRPDVVVLDIGLPDTSGFEVARILTARPGAPAVVLISSRRYGDHDARVRNCGARGFVAKEDLDGKIVRGLMQSENDGR